MRTTTLVAQVNPFKTKWKLQVSSGCVGVDTLLLLPKPDWNYKCFSRVCWGTYNKVTPKPLLGHIEVGSVCRGPPPQSIAACKVKASSCDWGPTAQLNGSTTIRIWHSILRLRSWPVSPPLTCMCSVHRWIFQLKLWQWKTTWITTETLHVIADHMHLHQAWSLSSTHNHMVSPGSLWWLFRHITVDLPHIVWHSCLMSRRRFISHLCKLCACVWHVWECVGHTFDMIDLSGHNRVCVWHFADKFCLPNPNRAQAVLRNLTNIHY